MPAKVICKFHKDPMKNKRTKPWTMSSMAFFNNQRQMTPKWLVWSGQNSNSSEISCLSWLPASLTKIWSVMNMLTVMNVLTWRQHFPIIVYKKFFQCSALKWMIQSGWNLNSWDLMLVLDTCKFGEDRIKNEKRWRHHFPHYKSNGSFWLPQ